MGTIRRVGPYIWGRKNQAKEWNPLEIKACVNCGRTLEKGKVFSYGADANVMCQRCYLRRLSE